MTELLLNNVHLEVKLFANRTLATIPSEKVPDLWASRLYGCSAAWSGLAGKLVRASECDAKAGKGRSVWKLAVDEKISLYDRIAPCSFTAVVKLNDQFYQYAGSYPTVSVKPCPSAGGMVLINFAEEVKKVDTSRLKAKLCLNSPKLSIATSPGNFIRFQIQLKKMEEFNAAVCKDDVTGKVYSYKLEGLFVVVETASDTRKDEC